MYAVTGQYFLEKDKLSLIQHCFNDVKLTKKSVIIIFYGFLWHSFNLICARTKC